MAKRGIDERSYLEGRRAAAITHLQSILRDLTTFTKGETCVTFELPRRVAQDEYQRQQLVAALRSVCAEFGDNDWDDDLHLVDVIEKHLVPYIRRKRGV